VSFEAPRVERMDPHHPIDPVPFRIEKPILQSGEVSLPLIFVRGFNPGNLQCPAQVVGAGREGRGPACFRPEAPGLPRSLRRRARPGRRSDP
jgi:hypothetical protein